MKVKQFLRKITVFIKLHKFSTLIVIVAIAVAGIYLWSNLTGGSTFQAPDLKIKKKEVPKEEKVRAPLSGVLVSPELAKRRPVASTIDNHPDARPHSGLSKASIVYDTYAEGGITRMLAVFQENDVKEIGPVRSARTEFVHWANELNAVFGHVGGSADALALIPQVGVLDLNQFNNAAYFWRSKSRFAPHNVYTSTDKLRDGGAKAGYSKEKEIKKFSFKDDAKAEERGTVLEVNVPFSGPLYAVKYIYDKESNSYKRFLGGVAHKDNNNGEQIAAKNIIVQYTTVREVKDAQVQAIGSGRIEYYLDGKKMQGTWSKASSAAETKYLDLDGKDIILNGGQSWVEVEKE